MKKRILSLLLILCMAVSLLPTAAFAADLSSPKYQPQPSEKSYPLYIGIYIPGNTGDTIDWPNEPCVSNKTYRYVKSDGSLGLLTNGTEGEGWRTSYASNASQYIKPTKDNFVTQYGAKTGADGTLGIYSQDGIISAMVFTRYICYCCRLSFFNAVIFVYPLAGLLV